MPLFYHERISDTLELGLWKISESVDELVSMLFLNKEEFEKLHSFGTDTRKRQWLSYRVLIRTLVKADYIYRIFYDENNRPYLTNPKRSISISHSDQYSAVLISSDDFSSQGIDIETIHPKVVKVKEKFLQADEIDDWQIDGSVEKLIVMWSAKEALFKKIGKQGLSLKEHFHLSPFRLGEGNSFSSIIEYGDQAVQAQVFYRIFGGLVITFTD